MLNLEMVRAAFPGRRIVWLDVCASTMREASRLASEGAPSGATVVCEEQTAGQGRHGRAWHSERASGLYVSMVLRPGLPEASAPLLTLALGLAAGEAIARVSGIGCDLRWPNDVLIGGKKCAGILVQAQGPAFIAGIGINVNHAAFPPELAPLATSLRLASGRPHSRELLLAGLLRAVDSFTKMLAEGGPQPLLRAFAQASSYARGKRVVAGDGEALVEGVTDGLDPSGFLYIRKDDGTRSLVLSGGLRPAE